MDDHASPVQDGAPNGQLTAEHRTYSDEAVSRARQGAMDWLESNPDGYPRSWTQELADGVRRGYELYDDFEAPPIAGYESLERAGFAVRGETVIHSGQERVRFSRIAVLASPNDEGKAE